VTPWLVYELRTLAMLLRQGEVPARAVQRLATRSAAWRTAAAQLERGSSLAEALGTVLPGPYAGALGSVADLAGGLDELAGLLADTVRRQRRWVAVLAYPLLLTGVLMGAAVFGLKFAVQPFVSLFEGMSLSLPWSTQIVIFLARGLANPAVMVPVVVLFGPLGLAVLWLFFGWSKGRLLLPVVGQELRHQEAQGSLSWLGFLLERGVPLPQAARVAAEACAAGAMKRQLLTFAGELERGSQPGEAARHLTWFPALARWLLVAAFESGAPAAALQEAARLLARDAELQATNSAAVVETLVMLGLSLAVGFVVIALFLPLYQLIGNL